MLDFNALKSSALALSPETANTFVFEPMKFIENLIYMGIGMLGVFMIVGIIMGATYLINFVINKIAESKKDAE